MLGGSDEDRVHQYIAWNALRKHAEEGQGHSKQACPKTPRKEGASLQQQNTEEEESYGMEVGEHQGCAKRACLGSSINQRRNRQAWFSSSLFGTTAENPAKAIEVIASEESASRRSQKVPVSRPHSRTPQVNLKSRHPMVVHHWNHQEGFYRIP